MTRPVSENVSRVAKIVAADLGKAEAGIIPTTPELFESTLPEGLTMENVKAVQNHTRDFIAGAGLAVGEEGIKLMTADKALESVSIKTKVVNDVMETQFLRSKEVPDGKGEGGRKAVAGYLASKYKVSGGMGAKGELKKVKAVLAEQALAAFS